MFPVPHDEGKRLLTANIDSVVGTKYIMSK